jgi:class 3 adenylate cyclase
MPQTRQLAAIMFTDIVGYTALMGEDEQRAFELLRKNRGLQKPLIERYNGQWIKELGDGVLTSFPNVTDAVLCATEIQRICNEKGDYKLRIGIHLGEVVFEDGDVFGDGVNIASRLQTLAPVGGIWISETVHQNVFNKKEIRTRFVREEVLKNVKEPIRVYEVGTEDAVLPFDSPFPAKKILPVKKPLTNVDNRKPLLLTSAVVLLLAVVGFWLYWIYGGEKTKQIHSIAVMPFVNESRSTEFYLLS